MGVQRRLHFIEAVFLFNLPTLILDFTFNVKDYRTVPVSPIEE